ncbi:MAG: hypothetical protein HYZ81_21415 [Nitrospinae bacterium]|nr:hypothetical protein [Nitrospinota bacterium]
MRASLILGLIVGLLTGLVLSNQLASSQGDSPPSPAREGPGRFQIAGHSTYPPLLLDSETGASWILVSAVDGEERRWVWEPIKLTTPPEDELDNKQRGTAPVQVQPRRPKRQITF